MKSLKKIFSPICIALFLCLMGALAFSCGAQNKHYVYYESDMALDKSYDEFAGSIQLYQPQILGYQFEGWWFDKDFTQQAPEALSKEALSADYVRLYAKFTEKRIESVEILGEVKNVYEYGEKFDANDAKIKVSYVDSKFDDETLPISDKMVSGFFTVDENVDLADLDKNNHTFTQNMKIGVDYCYQSVNYVVYSDLRNVQFDGELVFAHGENQFDTKNSSVVAKWTNLTGETGSTPISAENSCVTNYSTQKLGENFADLRFHFYTDQVLTSVAANEIFEKGEVYSNIYLNDYISLLDTSITLIRGKKQTQLQVEFGDIVEDIDTSTAGDHIAKIKYGENVVDVHYYVIDLSQAQTITMNEQLFVGDSPTSLTLNATMPNGKTISIFLYDKSLDSLDTSSQGKKTSHFVYRDMSFDVDYFVVDVNSLTEGEIKKPYLLNQLHFGMDVTFTVEDYTFTLSIYNSDDPKILTDVDTTSAGTKYAQIQLRGKQISVKYTVKES